MFKVGDRVRILSVVLSTGSLSRVNTLATIINSYDENRLLVKFDDGEVYTMFGSELELINKKETTMSTIKEKFVLALTSEPKKSFRKAGITNGDDLLTDDGQKIFLTWLLHTKHADEFKTAVVDGLLADTDKE